MVWTYSRLETTKNHKKTAMMNRAILAGQFSVMTARQFIG
jgi:hypothetical protein